MKHSVDDEGREWCLFECFNCGQTENSEPEKIGQQACWKGSFFWGRLRPALLVGLKANDPAIAFSLLYGVARVALRAGVRRSQSRKIGRCGEQYGRRA
ncbi:hypothetical protein [Bradyrhizobium sp. NAS96.2]|uniref:hypothetical protein n=1 Tax=Bradyrhizobium sp. NAS96.2 TaxID=1680160 RepID=UPI0011612FA1|nr:hypothetical protein [Bradyrhizobium sp. NAS96.2]